ncbi:hypothetical protein BTVI_39479 [Pitangus sulphuratus]|nr:hypothetical protein BTVI_39479 [Pitangus sulphuratus]
MTGAHNKFSAKENVNVGTIVQIKHGNVFPEVRGPKLDTRFEVWPHQCQVQRDDHCPEQSAGLTIFDTVLDAIDLLGHLGTLLDHVHSAVNQHPPNQSFSLGGFPDTLPAVLKGVVVAKV